MTAQSATTIAFDIYGTLVETTAITHSLEKHLGARAAVFSESWRAKQLEYSFRRGLMRRYASFDVCTRQALDYCCEIFGLELTATAKQQLLDDYRNLPAFDDVAVGLDRLASLGFRLFTLSNGLPQSISQLLLNAGLNDYFLAHVSVDEIRTFKPDPAIYKHFVNRTGSRAMDSWMVSGNAFDVIGAECAGINAVWLRRDRSTVYDPWSIPASRTISLLTELPEAIACRKETAL